VILEMYGYEVLYGFTILLLVAGMISAKKLN